MRFVFRSLFVLAALCLAGVGVVYLAGNGFFGSHEEPGVPGTHARASKDVQAGEAKQKLAATEIGVARPKQILFGDLHVHTTFSFDAYALSLPALVGEGAHPPADACDFARWCSALDFWSINDHAENLTPRHWQETVDSVRQCNAVSGDAANPDTVAYLGWEWTQVGTTPENHYGHKNVVLASTEEGKIPVRPIGAARPPGANFSDPPVLGRGLLGLMEGGRMLDYNTFLSESEQTTRCDRQLAVRELPDDCIELAATPAELYDKLDEWGHEAIVIPHGTTWGMYSPPGSVWDKQLVGDMHDEDRQTLIEVYSGHGDSEPYRDWRAVEIGASGKLSCPTPTDNYLPSCWQAGELIRSRCLESGEADLECESRAALARQNYVDAGLPGQHTVPGATAAEWLDSGQCKDCMEPAFNYRPGGSAQYILALGDFSEDESSPKRFRMGFMGSSDNHFARPGTGYKEYSRSGMTESLGLPEGADDNPLASIFLPPVRERVPYSEPFDRKASQLAGFQLFEMERQASFFLTGGLIAAHSEGRDRESIWEAMEKREVYGTTGSRILLYFDLINPPGSSGTTAAMGSEVEMDRMPIFQVRAVGSFEQKPGCPGQAIDALGPEEIQRVCGGECYYPSDQRRLISRVDIVKITPQMTPTENIAKLVADPWKSFECEPNPAGCSVTFSDPSYVKGDREALYYARVYETPKPGVNAQNVRCEKGPAGACESVNLCPGPRGKEDDCLASYEPRAWSSPIWLFPSRTSQVVMDWH